MSSLALSQAAVDCNDPTTTADMIRCETQELEVLDLDMKAMLYIAGETMKSHDRQINRKADKRLSHYDALMESQRAWLRFRDAQCIAVGFSARGGSMEGILVAACKREFTKKRIDEISELNSLYAN
jgi:uncharacterized protein YecT (DUF1311 family)